VAAKEMTYEYTYLLMGCLFLSVWLFLYWRRRDERRELLLLSLLFAVFGIAADVLYVKDWWHPMSVLGAIPFTGEALITAFGIIGVGAVLPEHILRLRDGSPRRIFTRRELHVLAMSVFTMTALFYGSFYFLGANSLVATILTLLIPTAFMWGARPDLIRVAIINGFALLGIAIPVYAILTFLTPGWIQAFYLFENTPALLLLGVPVDDAVFYFCTGLFFGTFYEWWQGIKRFGIKRKGKF
jgi:hypothetical protein